jgi:archaellum component FlaC
MASPNQSILRSTTKDAYHTNVMVGELREIISGLEERVFELEVRNENLSNERESYFREAQDLRRKLSSISEERDKLADQVMKLKGVLASEACATRTLERASVPTASSELKLEIYRQQIVMLNAELAKLKNQ